MSDNRTTELREKLDELIIELDRLDITLNSPSSGMTLGEYEQEREKLLDGFMQAIAATMGNGTCEIALARLVDVAAKVDIDSCAEILECVEAIRKAVKR